MSIPAEYGVLAVNLWLIVAAGVGLYALVSMIRRQRTPMTLLVVAVSMGIGAVTLFPSIYMNHAAVKFLKLLILFIIADLILVSLILKFRKILSRDKN